MKQERLPMTTKGFRELLVAYLTDPQYAKVNRMKDGRLSVKLPTGERFYVTVSAPGQ